jgi:sialic acid synthase SpsE
MRGGTKAPAKEEQVTIDFAFATVVAIRDIEPGEVLSKENIWVKRPGTGAIPASEFDGLLGRRAATRIESDTHLGREMISND